MELTSTTFRKVMGHFATGVTVVTVLSDDRPRGITVNALTSVSLEPPLVVIAIDRRRRITPSLRAAGRFAVNVLGEEQQRLSDCFAGAAMEPGVEEFCGAAWHPGETGLVLLDGAIATLECTVERTVSAGDHDMYIARVDALDTTETHDQPLLYFRRRYLRVERARELVPEGRQEQ